jgi:hypothetical protein
MAPLDGGPTVLISDGGNNPFGIAVDPAGIFWANSGTGIGTNNGSVMRFTFGPGLPIDAGPMDAGVDAGL